MVGVELSSSSWALRDSLAATSSPEFGSLRRGERGANVLVVEIAKRGGKHVIQRGANDDNEERSDV